MAVEKSKNKVRDLGDVYQDPFTFTLKSYTLALELAIPLWEAGFKWLVAQSSYWFSLQKEYAEIVGSFYITSPGEAEDLWSKSFGELTKGTTEYFENVAEKNWAFFNDCFNLLID